MTFVEIWLVALSVLVILQRLELSRYRKALAALCEAANVISACVGELDRRSKK